VLLTTARHPAEGTPLKPFAFFALSAALRETGSCSFILRSLRLCVKLVLVRSLNTRPKTPFISGLNCAKPQF